VPQLEEALSWDCAVRELKSFGRFWYREIRDFLNSKLTVQELSPLAHAAAGAALLRTDATTPLATTPAPSPAPSPVASREPSSLLALAPLPTPYRPMPVPSLLPRSLPTPKPPVPTPATSCTSSLVPSLAPRRFHPDRTAHARCPLPTPAPSRLPTPAPSL
jgi:hypothetical protein